MAVWTCLNFTNPRPATMIIVAASITIIRFNMVSAALPVVVVVFTSPLLSRAQPVRHNRAGGRGGRHAYGRGGTAHDAGGRSRPFGRCEDRPCGQSRKSLDGGPY